MTTATRTPTTTTRGRKPARTPADALRLETLRTEREGLENNYALMVVFPLCGEGYPRPVRQARLLHNRKFAWDFCWHEAKLAVELQGGLYGRRNSRTGEWEAGKRGGHTSAEGIERDAEKLDELTAIGWRCLVFTPSQVASGYAYTMTAKALQVAGLRSTR